MDEFNWRALLLVFIAVSAVGLTLSLAVLGWVLWRVRKIQLPVGADALTALRMTPLAVVILLDLLDLSLDIFSAPVSWTILGYLGLSPLRGVTVVESLIPGTQLVPTMTLAWLAARWLGRTPPGA
jgi:hypothetical protein